MAPNGECPTGVRNATNIDNLREQVASAHARITEESATNAREHREICARLEQISLETARGAGRASIIGSIVGSGGIVGIIQLALYLMQHGGK